MNQEFEQQMKDLLGNEYDAYMACLQQPPGRGFRINTLKGNADHLFSCMDLSASPSPFADNGYYTQAAAGIGHTPEYMAGAFTCRNQVRLPL